VMALSTSMANLLSIQKNTILEQIRINEERSSDQMENMRSEIREVEHRRRRQEEGQARVDELFIKRYHETIQRSEEFTLEVGDRLTREMREMKEDLHSEISKGHRSNPQWNPPPQYRPDHQDPSPILTGRGGNKTSPPMPPAPPNTPANPHTCNREVGYGHQDGIRRPETPPYHDLGSQVRAAQSTLQTAALQHQDNPHTPFRGEISSGVYLRTPNLPPTPALQDMGGQNQTTPQPGQGLGHRQSTEPRAPHPDRPPRNWNPRHDLDQTPSSRYQDLSGISNNPVKYTSAQMNSFQKPKPFGRATAYRSAAKFLSEYKFFIRVHHPEDPAMQATCMYGHLEGRAAQWYYTNVMDKPIMLNRDEMFAAFLKRFGGEDPETVTKGYRNRRQKKEETVDSYMTDMIDLLSNSQLDEKTQVDYLINGLRPEIGNLIRLDFPDKITQVETLATKAELSMASFKAQLKANTPEFNSLCELKPNSRNSWSGQGSNRESNTFQRQGSNPNRWRGDNESRMPQSDFNRGYNSRYQDRFNNRPNWNQGSRDDWNQDERRNWFYERRGDGNSNRNDNGRQDRSNSRGREEFRGGSRNDNFWGNNSDSRGRSGNRNFNPNRSGSSGGDDRRNYNPNRSGSSGGDDRRNYNPNRSGSSGGDDRRSYNPNRSGSSGGDDRRNYNPNRSGSSGGDDRRNQNPNRSGSSNRDNRSSSMSRNSNNGDKGLRPNSDGKGPPVHNRSVSRDREGNRSRDPTPGRNGDRPERGKSSDRENRGGSDSRDRSRSTGRAGEGDRNRSSSRSRD